MPQTIEIFRAGTHTGVDRIPRTFTRADVQAIAAGYSQAAHAAPIVVGHPAADAPAYAWVAGLRCDGDVLMADLDQVDDAFAEMVRNGRFRHVSAAFYEPDDNHNPKPGQWSLRHVGFLGAQPPAVRGLARVQFAAAGGFVAFMEPWQQGLVAGMLRRLREWMIGSAGQDTADRVLPSAEIDEVAHSYRDDDAANAMPAPAYAQPKQEAPMANPDAAAIAAERVRLEADTAALAAEQARLQVERAAFAQAQAALRAGEDAAFLDRLQAEGRALPANRADTLALLGHLPAEGEAMVAFAEGAPRSPREALKDLLSRQPKMVAFGQVAGGTGVTMADPTSAHDIVAKAETYRQAKGLDDTPANNALAIRAVTEGDAA